MYLYYLGLGSNLGNGRENLDRAVELLRQLGKVVAVSDYIETEPWGFESKHRFTNAVASFESSLEPMELLDETQRIERLMGRTHRREAQEPYTDRIIDIDLLTYNGPTVANERLVLPHPLIAERDFVKIPLSDCIQKTFENIINT